MTYYERESPSSGVTHDQVSLLLFCGNEKYEDRTGIKIKNYKI